MNKFFIFLFASLILSIQTSGQVTNVKYLELNEGQLKDIGFVINENGVFFKSVIPEEDSRELLINHIRGYFNTPDKQGTSLTMNPDRPSHEVMLINKKDASYYDSIPPIKVNYYFVKILEVGGESICNYEGLGAKNIPLTMIPILVKQSHYNFSIKKDVIIYFKVTDELKKKLSYIDKLEQYFVGLAEQQNNSSGYADSSNKIHEYNFILMDIPAQLFTMRQFDRTYLSCYRLFSRGLNSVMKSEKLPELIKLGLEVLFFMPLTHEEGHRSILTADNIGSISQPYFNKYGAAYVKGVTDSTLMNLRDNNMPTYIRLHTAGLESDYMLSKHIESMCSFEQEEYKIVSMEYYMRKLMILQYYITGLFEYDIDLPEEENELERDIVGYDTYGAAKHLFRPGLNFYRYTDFKDLTGKEKDFVKRLGWRSLLNILNPLILGYNNFYLSGNIKFNAGLGYTMAPFGDFIDENIWLKYKSLNFYLYLRQFQNRDNWFHGFGISMVDWQIGERLSVDMNFHFWQQPRYLDFNTSQSFTGGALDVDFRYFFFDTSDTWLKAYSLNLGLIYKTKGFLPEEVFMDEHFGLRIGTSVRL